MTSQKIKALQKEIRDLMSVNTHGGQAMALRIAKYVFKRELRVRIDELQHVPLRQEHLIAIWTERITQLQKEVEEFERRLRIDLH